MYQVDEKPETMETIHLYVVREKEKRPPTLLPLIGALLCVAAIVGMTVYSGAHPSYEHERLTLPAHFLPLKTFTAQMLIIPTGSKTYPATQAHGRLIIYNGSILSQELPQGMILTGKDNVEVMTDEAVAVPAGNPPAYGSASVSVHAVVPGRKGNIQAVDINQVYGTSLYLRNLQPFTGGQEAHTVRFITSQDRQIGLAQARRTLLRHTFSGLLQSPCVETVTGNQTIHITWTCQFVTYAIPQLLHVKVLHAQVQGHVVILDIIFEERPRIFTTK